MVTLMATKNLDEIGVAELCREAGVHRTTFYKHFTSVTGFATHVFTGLLDELASVDAEEEAASSEELALTYPVAFGAVFRHVLQERETYRRLLSANGDAVFQRIVAERMVARASATLRILEERGIAPAVDPMTAAGMIGMSITGALAAWAVSDSDDVERHTQDVLTCLPTWWPRTA